jgi:hypothetical protein
MQLRVMTIVLRVEQGRNGLRAGEELSPSLFPAMFPSILTAPALVEHQ